MRIGDEVVHYPLTDGFHYVSSDGDEIWAAYEKEGGAYEPEAFAKFINGSDFTNILKFFPTSEGFYDYENNEYIYQYKDHLGNIRLSYKRKDDRIEITDSNDYYPFGLNFIRNPEENAYFGTGSYANYKYNGKELQETGMYDYGARMYMPDLGRWGVIDPLAEATPHLSPYHYANNNPLRYNDPTGMLSQEFIDEVNNSPGGTTWTNNGNGFTNNWGGMMDNDGNAQNYKSYGVQMQNSFLSAGSGGNGGGTSLTSWMQNYLSGYGFAGLNATRINVQQFCCPDLALQVARGITISAGIGVSAIGIIANLAFSSAHIPEYAGTRYFYHNTGSKTFSLSDVKSEAKSFPVRERMGQTGSYTIIFEGGYKYHGKGPIDRMFTSALFQMGVHQTTVRSFEWTPSITDREAFKAEYRRMQRDATKQYPQGVDNPINYNIRQSPGYIYILQDGF